jgi:hypothetical protein
MQRNNLGNERPQIRVAPPPITTSTSTLLSWGLGSYRLFYFYLFNRRDEHHIRLTLHLGSSYRPICLLSCYSPLLIPSKLLSLLLLPFRLIHRISLLLLLNINRCGFLEEVGDHGTSHDLPSVPPSLALLSSFLKCDSSLSKLELL